MNKVPLEHLAQELDKFNQLAPKFSTLTNGQIVNHPWYLDGGGTDYKAFFLDAVKKHGKSRYNSAFEWCCGHTVIGFELLTQNLCYRLSFNDVYDLAVATTLENAERLGYKDRVQGFVTPMISSIPKDQKWDLVVGNPPNSFKGDGFVKMGKDNSWSDAHITHALRLAVDDEFQIHKEFFQNIKDYITQDADIFITLHSTMITYAERELSQPNGFILKNIIDLMPRDPDLKIGHYQLI